jgi:rubrerythrin
MEALAAVGPEDAHERDPPGRGPKRDFACEACGYGVFRNAPPERCPMCHTENAWIHAPEPHARR